MKRLNVVVTGPQAALSDSFISGVLRWGLKWGGRGSAGDTLFPKSVRVHSAVHRPGVEAPKQAKTSLCLRISKFIINVSPMFTPCKVSLDLRVLTKRFLFITDVVRNKKEIRKKALWRDYSQKVQCSARTLFPKESWFK